MKASIIAMKEEVYRTMQRAIDAYSDGGEAKIGPAEPRPNGLRKAQ
jgi:hypothetical protein